MTTPITIELYQTLASIGLTPALVQIELLGVGLQPPLVQTIRAVGAASATAAPSEAAVAAALAANRLIPGDDGRVWTLAATAAGKAVLRRVVSLLGLLSVVSVLSVLSVAPAAAATDDEELLSVDPDTRETAQDVTFTGAVLVPTPTATSQAANAGYVQGLVAAATPTSVAWGVITGTPSTLSGYGITDALGLHAKADSAGTADTATAATSAARLTATGTNCQVWATTSTSGTQGFVDPVPWETFDDGAQGVSVPFTPGPMDNTCINTGVYYVSESTPTNSGFTNMVFFAADSPTDFNAQPYLYSAMSTTFPNQYFIATYSGTVTKMALTTDSTNDYFLHTASAANGVSGTYTGYGSYSGISLTLTKLLLTTTGNVAYNGNRQRAVNGGFYFLGFKKIPPWATKIRVTGGVYSGGKYVYACAIVYQTGTYSSYRPYVTYTTRQATSNITSYDLPITGWPKGVWAALFVSFSLPVDTPGIYSFAFLR